MRRSAQGTPGSVVRPLDLPLAWPQWSPNPSTPRAAARPCRLLGGRLVRGLLLVGRQWLGLVGRPGRGRFVRWLRRWRGRLVGRGHSGTVPLTRSSTRARASRRTPEPIAARLEEHPCEQRDVGAHLEQPEDRDGGEDCERVRIVHWPSGGTPRSESPPDRASSDRDIRISDPAHALAEPPTDCPDLDTYNRSPDMLALRIRTAHALAQLTARLGEPVTRTRSHRHWTGAEPTRCSPVALGPVPRGRLPVIERKRCQQR